MKRLLVLCLLSIGCNAGRAFIASPGDYGDYRRVRIADSFDERMTATWYYLKTRPDGRYAERLKRYFDRAEPLFYAARSRNIEGLIAYLDALPDGPHASEAVDLLSELKHEKRRVALDERLAHAASMRLDTDQKSRKAAAELPLWWVRALIEPRMWQRPISDASSEFLVRWRLALPRPLCHDDDPEPGWHRCEKTVAVAYRVRGEGKRVERTISLDVELVMDGDWKLKRAMLSGKDVFVRAEEGAKDKAFQEEEARKEVGQRFVTALTKRLFKDALECNGGTDDKGVTTLDCEKRRVSIEPGPQGDDLVVIEPIEEPPLIPPEEEPPQPTPAPIPATP